MANSDVLDPSRIVRAHLSVIATTKEQWPAPLRMEIAFAGRSNVGKSSLLNALTRQHRLARTSGSPGCTRQLTFFDVETADAAALTLVDLPGYGFAQRSHGERRQWGEWIDTYLTERPTLRAVLVLFDVRRGVGPEERDLLTFLREERRGRQRPALILTATKLDELAVAKRKPRIAELQREIGAPLLGTAIADQRSIDRLWQHIRGSVGLGQGTLPAASLP